MAIRFTCEVSDPHTEAVLQFLGARLEDDTRKMLTVLNCAKKWLELEAPIPFDRSVESHVSTSLVLVTVEGDDMPHTPDQTPVECRPLK